MLFRSQQLSFLFLFLFISCSTFDFKVGQINNYPASMSDHSNVTQERFPDSNAVILFYGTDYEIAGIEDGKIVVNIKTRVVKKIFKAKTYSEQNRIRIDGDSKIASVSARLIKKNGEIKHIPEKDIFMTTSSFMYQGEKKEKTSIVFSDISAEDGDIVDKEYEFIYRESDSFNVALQNIDDTIPVLRREINIKYRDGFFINEGSAWNLRYKYLNGKSGALTESSSGGFIKITLVEKDLPERKSDSMTEYASEGIRSLLFSVSRFDSWNDLSSYYFNRSIAPALSGSDSGIVRNAVYNAVSGGLNEKQKIKGIINYVRKLTDDNIKNGYIDQFDVLPPSKTAELGKGNDRDRSLLLYAMLMEAGIKSELVYLNDRNNTRLVEDFPAVMFLSRMIVRCEDPENENGWLYLDPEEKYNPPLFQSNRNSDTAALVIGKEIKKALIKTPLYRSEQEPEIREDIKIKMISLDKAEVEVTIKARNEIYSRFAKLNDMNSDEVRESLSEYVFSRADIVDISGYEIKTDEDRNEVTVKLKAEMTPPVIKSTDRYYFAETISQFGFWGPLFRSEKKRTSDIYIGRLRNIEVLFELTLPEGFSFSDPDKRKYDVSLGEIIKTETDLMPEGGKYYRKYSISYLKNFVPAEKEKEYSEFLYNTGRQEYSIVFEKKEGEK